MRVNCWPKTHAFAMLIFSQSTFLTCFLMTLDCSVDPRHSRTLHWWTCFNSELYYRISLYTCWRLVHRTVWFLQSSCTRVYLSVSFEVVYNWSRMSSRPLRGNGVPLEVSSDRLSVCPDNNKSVKKFNYTFIFNLFRSVNKQWLLFYPWCDLE